MEIQLGYTAKAFDDAICMPYLEGVNNLLNNLVYKVEIGKVLIFCFGILLNIGHLGRSGSLVPLFSTPLMNRQMFEVVVYYVYICPYILYLYLYRQDSSSMRYH